MIVDLKLNPNSRDNTYAALEHAIEYNRSLVRKFTNTRPNHDRAAAARLRVQCLRIIVRGMIAAQNPDMALHHPVPPTDLEMVQRWLNECTQTDGTTYCTRSADLFASWFAWARLNGANPHSIKWLVLRLTRDFHMRRSRDNAGRHGIQKLRIINHAPPAPQSIADLL